MGNRRESYAAVHLIDIRNEHEESLPGTGLLSGHMGLELSTSFPFLNSV